MKAETDDCPSNGFNKGEPDGKCFGDGHYRCKECVYYRADFNKGGIGFIDFVHTYQNGITMDFEFL